MTSTIGNQIANYVLESQLWEMCLGNVFHARHQATGDAATILLLHPEINHQIPIKRQFLNTVEEIEVLEHPSIITFHEADEKNGRFFAIMPTFEGINLGTKIQTWMQNAQTIQLEEALLLMAQVAEALAHAHKKNIIHNALNPWSILIKRQPQAAGFPLRALICDFGIGKLQHSLLEIDQARLKRTLPYFSPEQTLAQTTDHRTDLFTVGVILYQLLTAQFPFNVETAADAILLHLNESPPSPRAVQKDIPEIVEQIVLKAINKKPEHRYQSGLTFAAALRNAALQLANQPTKMLRDTVVSLRAQLPAAEIDRLFIFGQDETARIFPLDKRVLIIGRSRTSDIRLPAEGISRHHVRLEQSEKGWNLIDLNSTNGSEINGEKIAPDVPHHWPKNQALHIGPYLLKWR